MRILVTGAAGGIGSTLSWKLSELGHELFLVDNFRNGYKDNLFRDENTCGKFYFLDVRETKKLTDILKSENIEAVIHMAAISALPDCEKNAGEAYSINVGGTASVLDACRQSDIGTCVFASTGAIYEGNSIEQAPFKENIEINTKLIYPTTKKMAEEVCVHYSENYGMNVPMLRFFNVFGPRQDIHRPNPPLINYLVREFRKSQRPFLHGTGNQSRDYVHVDDVVDICIRALNAKTKAYNVCTGKLLSVRDILKYVQEAMNTDIEPIWRESHMLWSNYQSLFEGKYPLNKTLVENETNKFAFGCNQLAKQDLGWEPNEDLKSAIKQTVEDMIRLNV